MRQLAPDVTYHSLVALGIASIQGVPVASFEKDDAERLLFFCSSQGKDTSNELIFSNPPAWLRPPAPSRKRSHPCQDLSLGSHDRHGFPNQAVSRTEVANKDKGPSNGVSTPLLPSRQRLKVAAMRPIPHVRRPKMLPFSGISEADGHDGAQVKANLPVPPTKPSIVGLTPPTQRKSFSSSSQAKQIISLNPLPLKKHGCGRSSIHTCSEVNHVPKTCGINYDLQRLIFLFILINFIIYVVKMTL